MECREDCGGSGEGREVPVAQPPHGCTCACSGAPATLDALPAVAAAVGGRVPVLVDGGIRRGTDIIKVLPNSSSA